MSLTGQLRPITGLERRLGEASRLGFSHAVVPASAQGNLRAPAGMHVHYAPDLRTAWELASEPLPSSEQLAAAVAR